MIMGRAKLLLRIAGVASAAVGLGCFPVGYGVNPQRDMGLFENLADTGIFVKLGLILIAAGAVMFGTSWFLPGEDPDDLL